MNRLKSFRFFSNSVGASGRLSLSGDAADPRLLAGQHRHRRPLAGNHARAEEHRPRA